MLVMKLMIMSGIPSMAIDQAMMLPKAMIRKMAAVEMAVLSIIWGILDSFISR